MPEVWQAGQVKGLRARGGYTLDMRWEGGKLAQASIKADKDGTCRLVYRGKLLALPVQAGSVTRVKAKDFEGL
ncbi:glycoside hydrolase family 95-like protein [Pontibacter mangrovi]|uniref:glycoside hydrolase family 95-like protein n=1 Tax=Pontibacter mangrovi TaxID=2589816 RepID=UPI00374426EC